MAKRKLSPNEIERERLTSNLSLESAILEWPCQNPVLREMVDDGTVVITGWRTAWWSGKDHRCAILELAAPKGVLNAGPTIHPQRET